MGESYAARDSQSHTAITVRYGSIGATRGSRSAAMAAARDGEVANTSDTSSALIQRIATTGTAITAAMIQAMRRTVAHLYLPEVGV